MKHSIAHDLPVDTATLALKHALASYQQKFQEYNPTFSWVSPSRATISFGVKGFTLKGATEVNNSEIILDLDVPFLFKPFQKKAIDVIEREVQVWLQKAREGQLPNE